MFNFLNTFINNAYAATETVTETVTEIVTSGTAQTAKEIGLWTHILNADPIVKITLIILVVFSVACWAVIFYKSSQLRKAQQASQKFWHKFSATAKVADLLSTKSVRHGPVFEIFATGQQTLGKIKKTGVKSPKLNQHHLNILKQRINQSREEELYKLEQFIAFLATTASVAPFIGLFGTVWGILTAFMAIGKTGASNLATVGPYIAEALVATALGLFAAIPAVIAYNFFVNKIKIINKMIDLFIDDFMLKSEQEIAS